MTQTDDSKRTARRGPAVWLDLDQQALDDAYDQSIWAPNAEQISRRRASEQRRVIDKLGAPLKFSYGPSEIETISVFRAPRDSAPVLVFVHGGAWRGGRADQAAFFAENILDAGAHLASLDFTDVVSAGGDLRVMMTQVRAAVAWLSRHAATFGGDPARLHLCGHSSGAHLSGCLLVTDWTQFGLSAQPFRNALLSSGMYDLTPVRLSKRSEYVAFTDDIVDELSSIRHAHRLGCQVVMTHGDCESPEFQRQTREGFEAFRAAGKDVELKIGIGLNHFETQETLANPFGFLGRIARELLYQPQRA